jgi:hypothetical protein
LCIEGLWALLLLAGTGNSPPTLALRVLDENGKPAAARVRIFDGRTALAVKAADGAPLLAVHPNFPELGTIVSGERNLKLPEGRATVVVERGTEYKRVEIPLESHAGSRVERTVRLERWIDMAARGWWSGDLHVHRTAADLAVLMQAADLHFAPGISGWNDSGSCEGNCEDERHWGAALFIGVERPMRLYPRDAEYPPPAATWADARERGAYIDLEKLIWWEAPVIAAIMPPDSIGVAVNHFREDGVSTRASLARPRDENRYPGERDFTQYILDLYCHYVSAGFRVPASAGSANGVARNALGYNRSYVHLGKPYSDTRWLAGQRAGHNFVTDGPMVFVTVNGERPGAVLGADVRRAQVDVEAESAADLDRIEILVDGSVARKFPGEGRRMKTSASVDVRDGSWIAVRCFEKNESTVRLAHTSPVYIGRVARRSPESLAYLRAWVKAEMERIRSVPAAKLTDSQKEEFLALCRKALGFYEQVR